MRGDIEVPAQHSPSPVSGSCHCEPSSTLIAGSRPSVLHLSPVLFISSDLPCHILFPTNAASLTVKVSMLKTPVGLTHSRHPGLSL